MELLLLICAIALGVAGVVGSVVPVMPGVLLGYAGILCAFFRQGTSLSLAAVLVWLAVAIVVTAADFYLPAYMTRRFGGSRAATRGAMAGLIAGMFLLPLSVLASTFAGAVIGEMVSNRCDFRRALKAGFGSFMSFIVGTGLKVVVTAAMLVHICMDALPASLL